MLLQHIRILGALFIAFGLCSCATVGTAPEDCPVGTQKLEGCPPIAAVTDEDIAELYVARSWVKPSELDIDPVKLGSEAKIPINGARTKFIGSTDEGALTSLAAKLWMIEHAEHTIDLIYYIFRGDLIGHSVLGALCDAVKRGVDVRIMVDSLGASNLKRDKLRALQSCAIDAGFVRNADGDITVHKARVQAVIFNAVSNIFVHVNRRSHDKLLLIDGNFPEKSMAITGGRNISLDYYGISPDGSRNPHTYRDADILVRGCRCDDEGNYSVGQVTEIYYSLLFQFKNNKRLEMSSSDSAARKYQVERELFRDSLADLRSLPRFSQHLDNMDDYMSGGFYDTQVRLAHELSNLTNKHVINSAVENAGLNPNSIINILGRLKGMDVDTITIVSPYMFAAHYEDKQGNVVVDEARNVLDWLESHPNSTVRLVTNSVMSSDNFFTQAVVDMDMVPRLLMSEELQQQWLAKVDESELNSELVESDAWREAVNHPRLIVYENGKLDSHLLNGDYEYSKLHAKYVTGGDTGFVGTTNFDYRSRLFNNEMGFFFRSAELSDAINANTEYLISLSYRWGSVEWLEMRKQLMETDGTKAKNTRKQRTSYKQLRNTGLHWMF